MSFTIPVLDDPDSGTAEPALLVLEDGTSMRGEAFGARGSVFGEAVFSTGMTGYQETLTDPSYHRQVIVMTAPHIGNTGMNLEDPESGRIWAAGFVIRDLSPVASNWRATDPLGQALADAGVVGVRGVDTRALTRHLRERGVMRVGLFSGDALTDASSMLEQVKASPGMLGANLSAQVSTDEPYVVPAVGESRFTVVAVDLGIKRMTPTLMSQRGMTVHVVPSDYGYEQIRELNPDGLFFSNGPGDPATADHAVGIARTALSDALPTFGICFGNQILGRALGFDTYKLAYGHRGINQPVQDRSTGRVEVTAHNHGFAVMAPLDTEIDGEFGRVRVSHVCLNDDVVEGLQCLDVPAFSVQYHPEAAAGPHDSAYLFDRFAAAMEGRS
jgi:carbamoyl-phosphate synthase small subunit